MGPTFVSQEMYFLEQEPGLFVQLTLPDPSYDRQAGVILLAPPPQEMMRFQKLYHILSQRLAESGFHCWRFDYQGTGDSPGSLEDVRLQNWLLDVSLVAEHAHKKAVIKNCSIIGLRLGGWLACELSREILLHQLILVDPVVNGERYTMELSRMHHSMLEENPDSPPFASEQINFQQCLGFPYTTEFHHDLEQVQLQFAHCRAQNIHTLISQCEPKLKDEIPQGSQVQEFSDDLGWSHPWNLRLQCFAPSLQQLLVELMEKA
ncbi:MAG: serine aminopeptidase domain-containing protein [Oligoflexus sp.]